MVHIQKKPLKNKNKHLYVFELAVTLNVKPYTLLLNITWELKAGYIR